MSRSAEETFQTEEQKRILSLMFLSMDEDPDA